MSGSGVTAIMGGLAQIGLTFNLQLCLFDPGGLRETQGGMDNVET